MQFRWTSNPPAPCHASGKQEPAGGPYLVTDHHYFRARAGDSGPEVIPRLVPLVVSASVFARMADAPGCPWVVVERDAWAAEGARLVEAVEALAEAQTLIEELQAELEQRPAGVDVDALVAELDDRYARKSGPKAKARA